MTSWHKKDLKSELQQTADAARAVTVKFADLMVASFGFVSALAWNDAVGSLFKPGGKLQFLNGGVWMYAVMVTLIALFVTYWRTKLMPPAAQPRPSPG